MYGYVYVWWGTLMQSQNTTGKCMFLRLWLTLRVFMYLKLYMCKYLFLAWEAERAERLGELLPPLKRWIVLSRQSARTVGRREHVRWSVATSCHRNRYTNRASAAHRPRRNVESHRCANSLSIIDTMAHEKTYRTNVRIGNWNEDLRLEEVRL